jgi:DNA-binding XRE family transcriptional regulator
LVIHDIFHSRAFHMSAAGRDVYEEDRVVVVDVLGRLLATTCPEPWEVSLLGLGNGHGTRRLGVGERIRARRQGLNLTQAQLAAAVGVDRSTVVHWEKGDRQVSLVHRIALARVLGGRPTEYEELGGPL